MYEDVMKEHGHEIPAIRPMKRDGYMAEDSKSAWKDAEALFSWHYGVLQQWGHNPDRQHKDARGKSFRELASDRFVIGTPDEAIKALEQIERELGINFIILRLHYVGMSSEAKVRQIRLFGEGVIPHFKTH